MKKILWSGVLLFLVSCTDPKQPNVELIQDMMEAPHFKAQEADPERPNLGSARTPPSNTIPVGFKPYPFGNDKERAARENKNPLEGDMSPEVLMVGQKFYQTHCTVCHGARGEGGEKMSVSEFMALKPPSLLSPKVTAWNDAEIYHVITMGQGVMGPYAAHIPQKYRWQVVNYIRQLQSSENKTAAAPSGSATE